MLACLQLTAPESRPLDQLDVDLCPSDDGVVDKELRLERTGIADSAALCARTSRAGATFGAGRPFDGCLVDFHCELQFSFGQPALVAHPVAGCARAFPMTLVTRDAARSPHLLQVLHSCSHENTDEANCMITCDDDGRSTEDVPMTAA